MKKRLSPPQKLLAPLTLIMFAGVAAGIIVAIYNAATAKTPMLHLALKEHAESVRAIWESLDEMWEDTEKVNRLRNEQSKTAAEIRNRLKIPSQTVLEIDHSAFFVARAKLKADGYLIDMFSRRYGFFQPQIELVNDVANKARHILRNHAVTTMAAAHSLVEPINNEVVRGLFLKLSEPNEEMIPKDENTIKEIVNIASPNLITMLTSLATSAQRRANAISASTNNEHLKDFFSPIIIGLHAESLFATDLVGKLNGGIEYVGREMLAEKLLADSYIAIKQARLLSDEKEETEAFEKISKVPANGPIDLTGSQEPSRTLALIRIENEITLSALLAVLLPDAARAPAKERFVSWMMLYGIYLLASLMCFIVIVRRLYF
ncbi:MAG: hypothetical protein GY847_10005 [Proteobacteria bacterium]|nr:hypothetical protein [Pseudomonadota bacterium]